LVSTSDLCVHRSRTMDCSAFYLLVVTSFIAVSRPVAGLECTEDHILDCIRLYPPFNSSSIGYGLSLVERCSLFNDLEECLGNLKEECSDETLEGFDGFEEKNDGFRLMLITLCNLDKEKNVYETNADCLKDHLEEFIQCFDQFSNTSRFIAPVASLAVWPCCRSIARLTCNSKVYMKSCPGVASLLQSFADFEMYQTVPICKKKNLFSYCTSRSNLQELYTLLDIDMYGGV